MISKFRCKNAGKVDDEVLGLFQFDYKTEFGTIVRPSKERRKQGWEIRDPFLFL